MNVLAVIPARGGSKGLPRKNLREVAGKPLLVWSVEAALAARKVDMVCVSSDDAEMLEVARMAGAVAVVRPVIHATDTATLDKVVAHAVRHLEFRADVAVMLQPTVPYRRPGLIDDCIQRLYDTDADSLFTAYAVPNCWWRVDSEEWAENAQWVTNNPLQLQRQQIPRSALRWASDGSVRVTRRWLLTDDKEASERDPKLLGGRIQVYPNEWSPDIDTERDLVLADAILRSVETERAIA